MAHLPIWFLNKLDANDCQKAFSEYMAIPPKDATMGANNERFDHNFRNTTVRFADKEHWFGKQLFTFGLVANDHCKWEFNINDHEAVQFAEYGVNQKYDWHMDVFPLSGAPQDRKITVVCLMNDPSEFEGGEFQMRLYEEYKAPLEKNTIIAFPSFLEHRVTPVIKGYRYSATMWLSGPRFR